MLTAGHILEHIFGKTWIMVFMEFMAFKLTNLQVKVNCKLTIQILLKPYKKICVIGGQLNLFNITNV